MVKRAFFRANIPFSLSSNAEFSDEFIKTLPDKGWSKSEILGDMILKHINTSFSNNVVCFSKYVDGIRFSIPTFNASGELSDSGYDFEITEIHVFCFDTGVGIISFHIPYDSPVDEEALINTCSTLRCCAEHSSGYGGKAIVQNGEKTFLSCLADKELTVLLESEFTLFNHYNDNSLRRVDMFTAALCDSDIKNDNTIPPDNLVYLLANAHDTRDTNIVPDEKDFYRQFDYTRWCFSKRGCSVVSNTINVVPTNNFLNNRWFESVKTNYFYLFLMVLHQKYAIYNYLNTIAEDTEKTYIKFNQESLIEFNSKYVFTIASDEQLIQNTYLRMKEINSIDEVYLDLLDEQKRMFDYSQLKNDENTEKRNTRLNYVSVIISILCSLSVIFDTVTFFSEQNITLTQAFSIYDILIILVLCISVAFIISKRKK